MIAAVLLTWAAYLALAIYCTWRAWRTSRALPAPWMRRLATSFVLAFFLAPSLIPAGHGVGPGPAWLAGVVWHELRHLPRVMLLPMAVTTAVFFAIGSAYAWLRRSAPVAPVPVSRREAIVTALVLLLPMVGIAAAWVGQTAVQRNERGMREAVALERARREADAQATGSWTPGSADQAPVLQLSNASLGDSGATLARAPITGEVVVKAIPGTMAPGTPVMIRDGTGKPVASATSDANGGFEIRVNAKEGESLRVVPVRILSPTR